MVGYDSKRNLINFAFQAEDSGLFSRETIISICEDLTHAHLILYCDSHNGELFSFGGVSVKWNGEEGKFIFQILEEERINMMAKFSVEGQMAGVAPSDLFHIKTDEVLRNIICNAGRNHVGFITRGYSIGYDKKEELFTFKDVSND